MKIYQFTCARCGNVSGHMSSSPLDAPTCCNGEEMYPTVAYMSERIWEVYIEGSAFPVATFAREDLACDWSGKMQKRIKASGFASV